MKGDATVAAGRMVNLVIQARRDVLALFEMLEILKNEEYFTGLKVAYLLAGLEDARAKLKMKNMPGIVLAFLLWGFHNSKFMRFKYTDFQKKMSKVLKEEPYKEDRMNRWLKTSGYAKRVHTDVFELTAAGREVIGLLDLEIGGFLIDLNEKKVILKGERKKLEVADLKD